MTFRTKLFTMSSPYVMMGRNGTQRVIHPRLTRIPKGCRSGAYVLDPWDIQQPVSQAQKRSSEISPDELAPKKARPESHGKQAEAVQDTPAASGSGYDIVVKEHGVGVIFGDRMSC